VLDELALPQVTDLNKAIVQLTIGAASLLAGPVNALRFQEGNRSGQSFSVSEILDSSKTDTYFWLPWIMWNLQIVLQ
jgi:hypothetical protein